MKKCTQSLLYLLLTGSLFLWSCKKDDFTDMPSQITIQFYTGDISGLDSATILLSKGSYLIEKKFAMKNDTASVRVSQMMPGNWRMKILVHTALPAGEKPRQGVKFAYRAINTLTVSRLHSTYIYSSPVGTTTHPGQIQAGWQPFYAYLSSDLLWLVSIDPCVAVFEAKSKKYNYFYNDKAFYETTSSSVPAFSYAAEYLSDSIGQAVEDEKAFYVLSPACQQENWQKAESMLIAMEEESGKEVVIYHQW